MKKYVLAIILVFVVCLNAFALDIVYPKKNPSTIDAKSTFFIGSTNPSDVLKINDVEVNVSPLGAFAQVVPLIYGNNDFVITNGKDTINFSIVRPKSPTAAFKKTILVEYPVISSFFVKNDGAPLRMTPVNAGINRLSHLPANTRLSVNGEKGNFYRVYLNSQMNAWIAKSDVEQKEVNENSNEDCFSVPSRREDDEFVYYEFDTSEKRPFAIKEENGLSLSIFNVKGFPDETYSLHLTIKKLFGYETKYDGDKFVLKIRKAPKICDCKPLDGLRIAIDAGHGGCENGAIGPLGDKEKDVNLAIAKLVEKELKSRGAKVIMTRDCDKQVPLQDRVNKAKDKDATLLVSIHANALPDGQDPIQNYGTSVYYYHNQAKALASSILASMTTELGTRDDKVRQGSLALTRPTECVSVLIEVGYIINPDDFALLINPQFQEHCAKSIADGIENYLKK